MHHSANSCNHDKLVKIFNPNTTLSWTNDYASAIEIINFILICEPKMLKTFCAKKFAFGNMASLLDHHFRGSNPSTFYTCGTC
jgi:hypothetical protein